MGKYLFKRILHGLISIVIVVAIVMLLIYNLMNRNLVLAGDPVYQQRGGNAKVSYKYQKWENYGYLDYVTFEEYLGAQPDLTDEERTEIASIGKSEASDSAETKKWLSAFADEYESKGYTITRLKDSGASKYGDQRVFASKEQSLFTRLGRYLKNLVKVDNIHYAKGDVGERKISFTLHDPVYGGEKFSPAIIGNGTEHKYLLYFDSQFPYIHQNLVTVRLGTSVSVSQGNDVFKTMNQTQGSIVRSEVVYPTGEVDIRADDLHTASYIQGSREVSSLNQRFFDDDYTNVETVKNGFSKLGYSFVIGILAVLLAYVLGVPLGIIMARKKDKLVDKIGTIYIVFIIAVPSLAYIFLFKAIGGSIGLPTTFDMDATGSVKRLMYVLPIVSLALPSVANLMKWLRRYMIDQMNSDYVKFARSGGLSENEIFSKHILKNAIIPIVHGIPGSVLGALTGAIITEQVYVVPGAGRLLIEAIQNYDNAVIVGVALFYAVLSVVSIILGDILMSLVDPRISFSSKGR